MGDQEEVLTTAIRFEMFTRTWNDDAREWQGSMLKAFEGPNGQMMLRGIASSTIKDLHGDNMLESALDDMERQANAGLTIFGNHSYIVPEDDYGHVEKAAIRNSGKLDEAGDPIYDLAFEIAMNDENDRAVKTWKSINKKSKLGLSIGAMIPPGGAVRDKKTGALTISHVNLLETSIVGIPANPRSWIENAVRASLSIPVAKAAQTANLGTPQLTLDTETGHYIIEGSIADIAGGDSVSFGFGKTAEPDTTDGTAAADDGEPLVIEGVCPDCRDLKANAGTCQNAFHSDETDPDVADAKIRIIEVDTGEDSGGSSSQEAQDSEPAGDGDAEVIDAAAADQIITESQNVMASLDPEVTSQFQLLIDLANGLNAELAASMGREQVAIAAAAQAERQRDEIVTLCGKLMSGTSAVLNKLADQPVGRRTVFREAQEEFSGLEGIYSRDFLTMLRSK